MRRELLILFVFIFLVMSIAVASAAEPESQQYTFYYRDGNLAVYPFFLPFDSSYYFGDLETYESPLYIKFAVWNCTPDYPLYLTINNKTITITKEGVYEYLLRNTSNTTMVFHVVLYTKTKILYSSTFYLRPESKVPEYLKILPQQLQNLIISIKLQGVMYGIATSMIGVYFGLYVKRETKIKAMVGYLLFLGVIVASHIAFVLSKQPEAYYIAVVGLSAIVSYSASKDYALYYNVLYLTNKTAGQKTRIIIERLPITEDFSAVIFPTMSLRPFRLISKKKLRIVDDYPIDIEGNPGIIAKSIEETDTEVIVQGDPYFAELLIDRGILERRTLELKELQEKFREITMAFDLLSDRKAWKQFEAYRTLRDRQHELRTREDIQRIIEEEMNNER